MRLLITLLLFVSCNNLQKKQPTDKVPELNIDSLERVAIEKYTKEPQQAIEIFKILADEYSQNNNIRMSGQTNLNIAGIYEEQLSEFSEALVYSKKSLNDWILVNDTMQMANLYKYIGYLEALNNNYEKAERDVKTAIDLYKAQNFNQGIAVSNINMSKIQILKSNFDEAEVYFKLSKDYWRQLGNMSRIFDNNLVGIRIFQNTNKTDEVANLIQENELIIKNTEINKYLIDKFNDIKKEIR